MKRVLLCLCLFSSCVQSYSPPPMKVPEAPSWKEPEVVSKVGNSCPKPELVLAETSFTPWWQVFDDKILNELESEALKNSPTVDAAVARLEQSTAYYGITRSLLFPEIDLGISAQRQRLSQTQSIAGAANGVNSASPAGLGLASRSSDSSSILLPPPVILPLPSCNCPLPPTPKVTKPSPYVNQLAILPTLNYELDFWGKNWQAMGAAAKRVEAQKEDVQTVLLVLTTSVADTYLQVRTYDAELGVLERTAVTRQNNYDLNLKQYEAGLINKLPVDQAKSDLEGVLASLEEVKRLRAVAENALAELVGVPAPLFSLERKNELPLLPQIPPGVPSSLLQRRPDIRQQSDLIEAAALDVGVAKTEYFPDFTITLDYGFISSKANKLFKWKSHTWLAAVDAVTPLFTAGRIESSIEQATAVYKEQVANYINTVLISFQEVQDAIVSIQAVKQQLDHLEAQLVAATEAYKIADTRYRMGIENYIVVVDSERTMLDVARYQVQVKRSQYSTTVSLIKSLGGIWE